MKEKTKEPQYQDHVTLRDKKGLTRLGIMTNAVWDSDPKRLLFVLSRYKFVAKILSGKNKVLEIGCGDAFGTRIVLQEVGSICAVDFDSVFVNDVKARMDKKWEFKCVVHDITSKPLKEQFDAAYSIDVIEHIAKESEQRYMSNICLSLNENGVLIIGTPSIQSQVYASEPSKKGHINCKSEKELRKLCLKYFYNVFIFSMNDEVVHTGFYPLAHYLFALCTGKKKLL